MLHTLVDKVFVITTLNSDRVDYIRDHLYNNNILFEFFVAPDFNIITDKIIVRDGGDTTNKNHRSLISLISAYNSIIECARISGFKKICIIEDDCFFVHDWKQLFLDFYSNIPRDWDILNVGYHSLHDTDTIKEFYNDYAYIPKNWHHTTHFMMINNTIYDTFLKLVLKFNYTIPADYIFNEIYKNNIFKSFCPIKHIAHQLSVRHDEYYIKNANVRFKSLLIK